MTKKNLTWLDVAGVFQALARMINRLTRWSWQLSHNPEAAREAMRQAIDSQRLENLKLDAQAKAQRTNKLSNEVVMTDARAELDRAKLEEQILHQKLKNLELQKKLEAAGLMSPTFEAENYAEPGDVRRGRMYGSQDNNTFTPDGHNPL